MDRIHLGSRLGSRDRAGVDFLAHACSFDADRGSGHRLTTATCVIAGGEHLLRVALLTVAAIVVVVIAFLALVVDLVAILVIVEVSTDFICVPLAVAPHVARTRLNLWLRGRYILLNDRLRLRLGLLGLGRFLLHRLLLDYGLRPGWLRLRLGVLLFLIFVAIAEEALLFGGLLFDRCSGLSSEVSMVHLAVKSHTACCVVLHHRFAHDLRRRSGAWWGQSAHWDHCC